MSKSFSSQIPGDASHIWDGVFMTINGIGNVIAFDVIKQEWFNTPYSREDLFVNATSIEKHDLLISLLKEQATKLGVDTDTMCNILKKMCAE